MPLLSFLIPVYNAGTYLRRCLDSIVGQEGFGCDVEIVVVDDGSKDSSLEIIKEYAWRFANIRWSSRENHGIGFTRNELVDEAQGKFLWFVDADDYISDGALSVIMPLLKADRYDMLMFAYNWISNDGSRTIHCSGEYASGLDMANHDVYNNSLWTRVYRRAVIVDSGVRFQNFQMGEDFDFIFRLIPHLGRCLCIDKPLYNYVVSPNSAITNKDYAHRLRSSEDSLKCIAKNFFYIGQYDESEQIMLRKPLNFFLIGYLFSIYIQEFPLHYKLNVMRRLKHAGAFPIYPKPLNPRHRKFVRIVNIPPLRYLSVLADAAWLKFRR